MTRALVVGAAGGIGQEIVRQLDVMCVQNIETVDIAGDVARRVDLHDFASEGSLMSWLRDFEQDEAPPSLIAWCAGIYDRTEPAEYDKARLREVVDTNLTSALLFISALTRVQRLDKKPRRLVLVGSQAGATGGTDAVYAASKAGITAATKSLAREYSGRGLLANVVSPGPTDTPMASVMAERRSYYESAIPVGRFNTPTEVAQVVAWLLLTAPATITGSVIDIDGGLVRR